MGSGDRSVEESLCESKLSAERRLLGSQEQQAASVPAVPHEGAARESQS